MDRYAMMCLELTVEFLQTTASFGLSFGLSLFLY